MATVYKIYLRGNGTRHVYDTDNTRRVFLCGQGVRGQIDQEALVGVGYILGSTKNLCARCERSLRRRKAFSERFKQTKGSDNG